MKKRLSFSGFYFYFILILCSVGVAGTHASLDEYAVRFEFPFGIGDLPTTVTRKTRVRSLISIESFIHERHHVEALIVFPPELKLCNLADYRVEGQNAVRLPFELRTENDVWYHLLEFEIEGDAKPGKYAIHCGINFPGFRKQIDKSFYIVDPDYAKKHIQLVGFTAPCDKEGNKIPRQQVNTFIVKDPASRIFRSFFLSETGHHGDDISFDLKNSGAFPVLLDVRYSIHTSDGKPVDWIDNLRQESGLAEKGIPLQVFIEPKSTTRSILTIRSRDSKLTAGHYEQRLHASLFTTEQTFLSEVRPLTIREVNVTNTSATVFALIIAVSGIVIMVVLRRILWGGLTSREYILIALYAAIAFSVVSVPTTVLSNLLHALMGPFSFLLTGVFREVIAYLLMVTLIVLLPRPGVVTSFLMVTGVIPKQNLKII
jgi:hypothetical protein